MSSDPGDLLRQHGLRATPQRRAIIHAFRAARDEHLSADEVLRRASAEVPDIGRGTVYATLAELTELGLLLSVGQPEPVRYELNTDGPHDHFRCRLCRRLIDIRLDAAELVQSPLAGYRVESVAIRAEGICAHCLDYRRGLSDGAAMIRTVPPLSVDRLGRLACRRHTSPVGPLGLAASADGIARIAFDDHPDFAAIDGRAGAAHGPVAGHARLDRLVDWLDDYFGGSRDPFPDAADLSGVPRPASGALTATREIPYDQPLSYHRLGIELPAYECGHAMGSNPVPLLHPCHRVTCGDERPEVYVGGPERLHLLQRL